MRIESVRMYRDYNWGISWVESLKGYNKIGALKFSLKKYHDLCTTYFLVNTQPVFVHFYGVQGFLKCFATRPVGTMHDLNF